MMLKNRFFYRMGTTSYIYPDTILPNVEKLKNEVDDIELVLFEYDGCDAISNSEIDRLHSLSLSNKLSYTVHLPTDVDVTNLDRMGRNNAVEKMCQTIKKIMRINPYGYIIHLNTSHQYWESSAEESLTRIIEGTGIDSVKLCVENIHTTLEPFQKLVERCGLSYCLDIGHLNQHGFAVRECVRDFGTRTRIMHLYGTDAGGMHYSLKKADAGLVSWVLEYLHKIRYSGVLTLEVFSSQDFIDSKKIVMNAGSGINEKM